MLVREVLSDRYRITQEKFQYQGVEILMTFRACTRASFKDFPLVGNLLKGHVKIEGGKGYFVKRDRLYFFG